VRTDYLRVADALAAIENSEQYARRGREEFEANELIQVWFLYHLAIIGEALRATSGEFQAARTEGFLSIGSQGRGVSGFEFPGDFVQMTIAPHAAS
jgi:hypothetical protein